MSVIQKDVIVPDYLVSKIKSGEIKIMGLAKNSDNGQIVQHLDAYDSNGSNSTAKAGLFIGIGLAALAGIGYGIYTAVNDAKIKRFKESLNLYIKAVNNKSLTKEIIDNLLAALDNLKGKLRKNIQIEFSSNELTALIECLCNHTQTLADANNIKMKVEPTKEEETDILLRFRNNLVKQRSIFELAA